MIVHLWREGNVTKGKCPACDDVYALLTTGGLKRAMANHIRGKHGDSRPIHWIGP